MRNVITHMHFPKTGGTTLSDILDREFGDGHQKISFFRLKKPDGSGNTHVPWEHVLSRYGVADLEPEWDFDEARLADLLERNGAMKAVSRHGMIISPSLIEDMMAGTESGYRCRILPVFFLRKFLPWHVSLYFQQRRDPEYMVRLSCDPELWVAKTGTLREYTRYCVGSPDSHRRHKSMYNWTTDDADRVLDRIELYQIGLMDRYDESLVVMENALRQYFPGLDLSYGSPRNVGGYAGDATTARYAEDLERDIGADLTKDLARMGAWSDGLYNKMDRELDRRVSRIPDFREKMDDFESRCRTRRDSGSA